MNENEISDIKFLHAEDVQSHSVSSRNTSLSAQKDLYDENSKYLQSIKTEIYILQFFLLLITALILFLFNGRESITIFNFRIFSAFFWLISLILSFILLRRPRRIVAPTKFDTNEELYMRYVAIPLERDISMAQRARIFIFGLLLYNSMLLILALYFTRNFSSGGLD
jgi:hypothetical protein